MDVTGISNSGSYFSNPSISSERERKTESNLSITPPAEVDLSVNISSVGKKLVSSEKSGSIEGLESYRIPQWMADYHPPMADLSESTKAIEEGRKYMQLDATARVDGVVSLAEKKAIDSYRSSMLANESLAEKDSLRIKFADELDEYSKANIAAFESAKSDLGIETNQDYLDKVLNDHETSEIFHQSFRENLLSNPRTSELMKLLGVKAGV